MPVYGYCEKCGTETIDYGCVACDGDEIENLKDENEDLKAKLEASEKELEIKSASLKSLMAWIEETGNYPPTDNPPSGGEKEK